MRDRKIYLISYTCSLQLFSYVNIACPSPNTVMITPTIVQVQTFHTSDKFSSLLNNSCRHLHLGLGIK